MTDRASRSPKKIVAYSKYFLLFLLLFLSIVLLFTFHWIEYRFGKPSLQSIVFTLTSSLDGVSAELVFSYVKQLLASVLVFLVLSALIGWIERRFRKRKKRSAFPFLFSVVLVFFLATIGFLESKYAIVKNWKNASVYSSFVDDHYTRVERADFPAKKMNIVLLMLESMEDTFNAIEGNPPLLPRLQAIQEANTSFQRQIAAHGTEWTIAALTSYLFGLPLLVPIEANSYGNFTAFLPNAPTILELLEKNGYGISFIAGSKSTYSGIKTIFTTHCSNARIYDQDYFIENKLAKESDVNKIWGLPDRFTYARSKEILQAQAESGQPFFSVIMTIDTHVPGQAYGDYPRAYGDDRDAFDAADRMAAEFASWFKEQPFSANTLLIMIGDHPYMSASVGGIKLSSAYTDPSRTVYNALLNSREQEPASHGQRLFTAFDIAPTLLESAGIALPEGKFGLGVSLYGPGETLLERYGLEYVNERLLLRSRLYDDFLKTRQ